MEGGLFTTRAQARNDMGRDERRVRKTLEKIFTATISLL
jgi:hypothetical protein